MRDNTKILTIITYVILLGAVSALLNDIREFDFNQFEKFQNWAKRQIKMNLGLHLKMPFNGVIML